VIAPFIGFVLMGTALTMKQGAQEEVLVSSMLFNKPNDNSR
jgi:hypothetical protein